MNLKGRVFPDLNEWHYATDFDLASAAGIVGWRARGGGITPTDLKAVSHREGFRGRGIVQLVYSSEPGAGAFASLVKLVPWQPGIVYVADVEAGGMTAADAAAFVKAARAGDYPVGEYRNPSKVPFGSDLNWLAQYGPTVPPISADVWQYSNGVVGPDPHGFPGVPGGGCDMNLAVRSLTWLQNISHLNVPVPPSQGEDDASWLSVLAP